VSECRSVGVAALIGDSPPAAGRAIRLTWRSDDGKTVVDSLTAVFVSDERVRLVYRRGSAAPVAESLDLVTFGVPHGGVRFLAVCPRVVNGAPCRRRIAKVYLPPWGPPIGCRHCLELTYPSRQSHDPRVTRLLQSGELPERLTHLGGLSVQKLGLTLFALIEGQRRHDRAAKKFEPKPKARRRKVA
jgi:hypothetical protein